VAAEESAICIYLVEGGMMTQANKITDNKGEVRPSTLKKAKLDGTSSYVKASRHQVAA
jgi:hypothetical protein